MANRKQDIISNTRKQVSNLIDAWETLHNLTTEMLDRRLMTLDERGIPQFNFTDEMFEGANSDLTTADFEGALLALNYINSISPDNRAALQVIRV